MRVETEHSYRERILRVLVHIQNHLDEALPLEELARVAHFSPFHFHRVFRGMVGESVKEHIRRLRLERAAQQLKYGGPSILGIALEAGYETHEAFTRAFSAAFGISPSRFRSMKCGLPPRSAARGVHVVPGGETIDFHPSRMGDPPMDVRVETFPARRVAFMRHVGPYRRVGDTWARLMAWAAPWGLVGPETLAIGVARDDPDVTPPDKVRYDACLTVGDSFLPEGAVGVQQVGGGEYAITTHRGPYENVGRTAARLCGEWLPSSGREPRSAPVLSVHRNCPPETPPEDLVTDIYLPLE